MTYLLIGLLAATLFWFIVFLCFVVPIVNHFGTDMRRDGYDDGLFDGGMIVSDLRIPLPGLSEAAVEVRLN